MTADTHVHLLAGFDDGPQSAEEALAMCRQLARAGVSHATALAHQNPDWPLNTPDRLRAATAELQARLNAEQVPLKVYPAGEVVLGPDTLDRFHAGELQSVGDHNRAILVEMPHASFLDARPLARVFRPLGVRLVIAHAERYPELLYDTALTESFIEAGCLIQVTTDAVARPADAAEERALKDWFARGIVHVLGSDGHNLDRRPVRYAEGLARVRAWAGVPAVNRIAGIWGTALLQGSTVEPPPPRPRPRHFFARLLGG